MVKVLLKVWVFEVVKAKKDVVTWRSLVLPWMQTVRQK